MPDKGIYAIIPARGGSKRLPRKNLLPLAGKPLIAWTIEAALRSKGADRVIVSTEDAEIARVAESYGAEVPFMRPVELATDTTTTMDVIVDLLGKLPACKSMMLLQPTSPLRTATHISQALDLFREKQAKGVIGVCEVDHPVEWTNTLPDDGCMDGFLDQKLKNLRSQDLPTRYRVNGAIYIMDTETFLMEKTFYPARGGFAYRMERESSIDIDGNLDFMLAELLMQARLV